MTELEQIMNESVMIRVRRTTRDELQAAILQHCIAINKGRAEDIRDNIDNNNPRAMEISLDRFIRHLLSLRNAHATRARRQREKRKATRAGTPAKGEK